MGVLNRATGSLIFSCIICGLLVVPRDLLVLFEGDVEPGKTMAVDDVKSPCQQTGFIMAHYEPS